MFGHQEVSASNWFHFSLLKSMGKLCPFLFIFYCLWLQQLVCVSSSHSSHRHTLKM